MNENAFFENVKGTEDKTETIRIQTMDGAKQTVGIHTDITFEIDDKKNDSKPTDGKNAESSETEDEVPIYKGTHTDNDRNDYNRRYDPHEHHMNHPSFHGVNDEEGIRYADAGTWIRFLPSSNGGWTTERYSESFKPQSMCYTAHNANEIISKKKIFIEMFYSEYPFHIK